MNIYCKSHTAVTQVTNKAHGPRVIMSVPFTKALHVSHHTGHKGKPPLINFILHLSLANKSTLKTSLINIIRLKQTNLRRNRVVLIQSFLLY